MTHEIAPQIPLDDDQSIIDDNVVWLKDVDAWKFAHANPHQRGRHLQESLPGDWSAELVLVGRQQDKAAFSKLFAHFAPRIKSTMLRYGLKNELAEEVAQETFVLVWRKASQFDPEKAMASTWIFTLARNKKIDLLRKQGRPEADVNDPAFEQEAEQTPDQILTTLQRAKAIKAAMEKLPEQQRIVLQKSYFADETQSEIAASLKAPLGTVKSRLRLALEKLRTILDADLGEGSI
ncbi:sigma-70 family RNA polymerase sigma factor [Hirschia litorea]|uniref:Sigma-70 family RNA polymerase sigma factor n=1 Tax=Hirschia litorea TaxID=1199156 RepID=A0ABW2INB0_9PROT